MVAEASSVSALVAEAAARLAGRVAEPRRTARRILRDLAQDAATDPWLAGDDAVPGALADLVQAAVARVAAGEPLEHVTGLAGFRHLTLRVDARALIPRPETEGLVTLVLERCRTGAVADIGTGSGCIALALATEGGFDLVLATDRSSAALTLAAENAARHGVPLRFVRGHLTVPLGTASLDALVSNPPYLSRAELDALDPAVARWEPHAALDGGVDGLDQVRELLDDGRRVLRAGGLLALELDAARAGAVAAQAAASGWRDATIHEDIFGRPRFLLAVKE